jgi:hypothetical protein
VLLSDEEEDEDEDEDEDEEDEDDDNGKSDEGEFDNSLQTFDDDDTLQYEPYTYDTTNSHANHKPFVFSLWTE